MLLQAKTETVAVCLETLVQPNRHYWLLSDGAVHYCYSYGGAFAAWQRSTRFGQNWAPAGGYTCEHMVNELLREYRGFKVYALALDELLALGVKRLEDKCC